MKKKTSQGFNFTNSTWRKFSRGLGFGNFENIHEIRENVF